jgi:MFS transporter, DHA3 family, macrolide efflux protein
MTTITIKRYANQGMLTFGIVWFGQLISFIGSGLSSFGLGVWVYQSTGSITLFALISLFANLPGALLGPFAGTLVDRWDRRKALLYSDLGAGISTTVILLLFLTGGLELWHLYLATFVSGTCAALRWPALTAATTQLVPKRQYARVNGLLQIVLVGRVLVSPLLAGVLIGWIGLQGIILVDFTTFLFAIGTLQAISIPRPEETAEGKASKGSFFQETVYGWRYITARPGLFALMNLFSMVNFLMEMTIVLFTPLVLSFGSPATLGSVMSLGGIGYLAGSVVASTWNGAKRRAYTVIGSMLLMGLFMIVIGLQPTQLVVIAGTFMAMFCLPILSCANQVIWQEKVASDLQGRVFAIRGAIVLATPPLAYLAAGPLSDRVFEPLMAANGLLAGSLGRIIGIGQGRGIALLVICMGLSVMLAAVAGYLNPHLRKVEDELPHVA